VHVRREFPAVLHVVAQPELDPVVGWQRGIAFGQSRLQLGRPTERVDDAGELDQKAVAGGLDNAIPMP
jgi:hypothetical protein